MKVWFASLAACAVLGELADALAPEKWREHVRRISALAALAVLLSPVRGLIGGADRAAELGRFLPSEREILSGDAEDGGSPWQGAAGLIFETAAGLGVDTADMTAVFSEEDGALTGIRLILPRCPYNLRAELARVTEANFGVPVTADCGGEEEVDG